MSLRRKFDKLKVFETFAGIGAQHKALEILKKKYGYDYEIVATSEWDVYANISYDAIHNGSKKYQINLSKKEIDKYLSMFDHSLNGKEVTDIKKILSLDDKIKKRLYKSFFRSNNLGSILKITGKELIKKAKSDIDLITYSFPCQDLSISGSFHGFNKGMAKGSGTRSSLLWEIERILIELKEINKLPKFLLLENVKNMLSKKHEKYYRVFLKSLYSLGYATKTYLLNAKDYGIPQNRERVYALSILNYKGKIDKNGNIKDLDDKPSKIFKTKKLVDIIKTNYENNVYKEEAIESQPNRTPSRKIMFELNRKLNDFNNVKFTRTLTTKQDRHPNAGIVDLKGTKIGDENREKNVANYRFITPREAYLLMGFAEEDFDKVKKENISKERLLHQAGNSIVVDVIAVIMKKIQEFHNE